EQFYEWFESNAGCPRQTIREHSFRSCIEPKAASNGYEAPPCFVMLGSADAFTRVMKDLPKYYINPHQTGVFDCVHMPEKTTWGRQLILKVQADKSINEEQVKTILGSSIVDCKRQGKKGLSVLHLTNLPADIEEQQVRKLLGPDYDPQHITILRSDPNNYKIGSTTVRITFDDRQQCNRACQLLANELCKETHLITIFSQKHQ
ncbi:unnamed protein product, partial [Adineta ricciae]